MKDKEIIEAIAEHLGLNPEDIDREANLQEDLNLSPIELNDLIATLATKFDITFSPEDIEGIITVEDLIALVEDNLLE